ncbi:MAG: hypothetical protein JXR68_12955 [Bacteroidales bacterium]|nr:hypothetical protein [Bacteroidales bacterium]
MAIKIKFNGTGDGINDNEIHFAGVLSDYTLCGLTLDGDPATAGGFDITKEKVNCEQCIQIVEYTKKIRKSNYCL